MNNKFIGKVLLIKSIIDNKGVCTLDNRTKFDVSCKQCFVESFSKNGYKQKCNPGNNFWVAKNIWNDMINKGYSK